jgi:hypothetical protein
MKNLYDAYSSRKFTSTPDLDACSQRSSATYIVDPSHMTSLSTEMSSSSTSLIEAFKNEEKLFLSTSSDQDQDIKLSKNIDSNKKHNTNIYEHKLLNNIFDSFHSKRTSKLMHKKKRQPNKITVMSREKSTKKSFESLQTEGIFSQFEINCDIVARIFMVFCFIVIIFYFFLVLPISYSFSKKKLVVFSFR